jgi:hypothetical protein
MLDRDGIDVVLERVCGIQSTEPLAALVLDRRRELQAMR